VRVLHALNGHQLLPETAIAFADFRRNLLAAMDVRPSRTVTISYDSAVLGYDFQPSPGGALDLTATFSDRLSAEERERHV